MEEEDWDNYGAGRGGPNIRRLGSRRRKPRGRGAKSARGGFQEGNESEEAARKSRGGGEAEDEEDGHTRLNPNQ